VRAATLIYGKSSPAFAIQTKEPEMGNPLSNPDTLNLKPDWPEDLSESDPVIHPDDLADLINRFLGEQYACTIDHPRMSLLKELVQWTPDHATPSPRDGLHEITYEAIKNSELFNRLENWEVDVKADQLHDEVVRFMEQWIEKEVSRMEAKR